MEEKVVITLLEANREVPSRDQIIERFKGEFKASLEHSLANPQEVAVSPSVRSMADSNQDSLEALQIREEVTVDPAVESESARAESRWTYADEESGQFVAPEAAAEAETYQPAEPTPIPEEELFVAAPQPQVDEDVMAGLEAIDDGMSASVAQGDRAQVHSEEMSSSMETVTSVSSLDEPSASLEAFQEEATQSVDDEPMTSQPSSEGGKKKKKKKK